MRAFELTSVTLANGVDAALALVPATAGVGQILAEGGRNLVIGRPANLRKWTAGHLGRARLPKVVPGKLPPRPPTDLTPIATEVAYAEAASPFGQRLAYERLMARYVPPAKRRDLKRPAYLRLAPEGGYPHLVVQPSAEGADVFGPFRDTRAAARARDALYRHFRIRPCDFDFKAPTDLPAGLAADVARVLEGGAGVPEVPPWVQRAGGRSLVADRAARGVAVFPIARGGVIDASAVTVAPDALVDAVAGVDWEKDGGGDDTPWLNAWRHGKRTGIEVLVLPGLTPATIAAHIREVVG